jgi:hypothetical protein
MIRTSARKGCMPHEEAVVASMLALAELVGTPETRSEITNDFDKLECSSLGIRYPYMLGVLAHMVTCRIPTSSFEEHPLNADLGSLALGSHYGELGPDVADSVVRH